MKKRRPKVRNPERQRFAPNYPVKTTGDWQNNSYGPNGFSQNAYDQAVRPNALNGQVKAQPSPYLAQPYGNGFPQLPPNSGSMPTPPPGLNTRNMRTNASQRPPHPRQRERQDTRQPTTGQNGFPWDGEEEIEVGSMFDPFWERRRETRTDSFPELRESFRPAGKPGDSMQSVDMMPPPPLPQRRDDNRMEANKMEPRWGGNQGHRQPRQRAGFNSNQPKPSNARQRGRLNRNGNHPPPMNGRELVPDHRFVGNQNNHGRNGQRPLGNEERFKEKRSRQNRHPEGKHVPPPPKVKNVRHYDPRMV
mmetsp:Transcript_16713/g.18926  ORF Transcript_16713/g.18926 Transcript_16713/m.18926 type:complete len:305 (-) Transcript_16713:1171-2085(-)|eukprot:CAMPEP_0184028516 /NCGR_PEP_ID=MMETSP0954-20121128/14892_1 /TAXON_ID=627963 /ORGANISM="Aplanochytrium sp, Strain PBS07" /LENGTH=304 /DNA_ID=CAMNT_0026313385 /DNA_START=322 /DNA_END=1236 /DNA_ORIENTATION=-